MTARLKAERSSASKRSSAFRIHRSYTTPWDTTVNQSRTPLSRASTAAQQRAKRLRNACLSEHWILDLADARRIIEARRIASNSNWPNSALAALRPTTSRQLTDGMPLVQ